MTVTKLNWPQKATNSATSTLLGDRSSLGSYKRKFRHTKMTMQLNILRLLDRIGWNLESSRKQNYTPFLLLQG